MNTAINTISLSDTDRHWMTRALQLAARGLFTVSPNPCVGCVIVKDGRNIGEGFHQQAGCAHAEVNALSGLSLEGAEGTQDATVYVTLEPCCHHGKTPPCTSALINAKVARVVVTQVDPNPLVSGQGIAQLRAAGITVDVVQALILQDKTEPLNLGFLQRMRGGLPLVRVKLAVSMDGRTALANGESQWLTGEAARQDVQYLRAQSCAIISSARTVLQDQARLTVRAEQWPNAYPTVPMMYSDQQGKVRQPLRVIVDRQQRMPIDHVFFQQPGRTLWCVAKQPAQIPERVDVLQVPFFDQNNGAQNNGLDLTFILRELAKRQCNEVLVEAGPRLASGFLEHNLVDEIYIYMAPLILGDQAKPLFYTQLEALNQAKRWQLHSVDRIDNDVRLIWSRACLLD